MYGPEGRRETEGREAEERDRTGGWKGITELPKDRQVGKVVQDWPRWVARPFWGQGPGAFFRAQGRGHFRARGTGTGAIIWGPGHFYRDTGPFIRDTGPLIGTQGPFMGTGARDQGPIIWGTRGTGTHIIGTRGKRAIFRETGDKGIYLGTQSPGHNIRGNTETEDHFLEIRGPENRGAFNETQEALYQGTRGPIL